MKSYESERDSEAFAIPDSLGQNLLSEDPDLLPLLSLYLSKELLEHLTPHLVRLGSLAGGRLEQLAATADKKAPELSVRSRQGLDHNLIVKDPSYVELERWAFSEFGLAAASHVGGVLEWPSPLPAVAKYTLFYLFSQAEFGLTCPVNMTDSLTRTLKKYGGPELIEKYLPRLTSRDFDTLFQGAMFMTEQHAGSDIAQTEVTAKQVAEHWELTGDKWFCSNAGADLAMVLARSEGAPSGMAGVSLFLMPKILDDGSFNNYRIIRLKDKLGTRSMASGEIRLDGAKAYLVGEIGRGFQQMTEMVNSSRLSNGIRSGALMRRALTEASFFSRNRKAFGSRLADLPLMALQLRKMALPTEQARTFGFNTAQALERADAGDDEARRLVRIMTPLIKFRACRDARKITGDAMEVRGGCGYIEEWPEPRLLRDAHLGSIWEGTSNIVALDVFRAIQRDDALTAFERHFQMFLNGLQPPVREKLESHFKTVIAFAEQHARANEQRMARQVSSLLYHISTAILFFWEAQSPGLEHREQFGEDTIEHRLLPVLKRI